MVSSLLLTFIKKNPFLCNATSGGFLCAASDLMAQEFENANEGTTVVSRQGSSTSLDTIFSKPIDWSRACGAALIGSFAGGIVYPMAYARLDATWVGTEFWTVLKKSLVEIATVGIFVNSISMTSRGIWRGDKSAFEVIQHVATEIPTVTRNDFCVWFPYNMLAFTVISPVLRPISTAAMEASWQTYISWRSHDYHSHSDALVTH